MCEVIALTAMAVSGGMQAYAQHQQGQYAQAIENRNATVSRMKADQTLQEGLIAEEQHRAKVRQIQGEQIAAMGESGLQTGTGTFGNVLEDTAKFGELDALQIRTNALRSAWSLNNDADASVSQGAMAKRAGNLNSYGTILGTAGSVYSAGKQWKVW